MANNLLTGRTIGNYLLLRHLGRGGMASVYLAQDQKLKREVAFKVLHGPDADEETFQARFEQEALSTARLDHPNIIHIYDYGQEGDLIYMVVEYCPNGSLSDLLVKSARDGKILGSQQAASIASQIALGLDFAHQNGIIHRDIKPSNILFARDGRPVLADLGIAKALVGPKLTSTMMAVGTPEYMSPEQGRGDPIDHRSDLYSLGVVLYEMLVGKPPFQASTPWGTIYQHISEPLPPLRERNPEVPTALAAVVEKALAKDPADRFQSGREMAQALGEAPQLQEMPVASEPAVSAQAAPTTAMSVLPRIQGTPSVETAATASKVSKRPRALTVIAALAVLSLVAVAFLLVGLPRLRSTPAGPSPTQTGSLAAATRPTQIRPATATAAPLSTQTRALAPALTVSASTPTASGPSAVTGTASSTMTFTPLPSPTPAPTDTVPASATPTPELASPSPSPSSTGIPVVLGSTPTQRATARPVALSGRLVYASNNNIMALDVATKKTWQVAAGAHHPSLLGSTVLADGNGNGRFNLLTASIEGRGEKVVGIHAEDSCPSWSPSGQSAVFHSTLQGDGKERIYIQQNILRMEEPVMLRINNSDAYGRCPLWMENWRVAFSGCNYWATGSLCGIYTVNGDGSDPIRLTEQAEDTTTDSRGNNLLFSSRVTGNWEVYQAQGTGGAPRNLTRNSGQDVGAAYSPNGQAIAFISNRDGGWGIWVMNADGSSPRKLLAVPDGFGPDWMTERLSWGP